MKDSRKLQEAYDALVVGFLAPLVSGGLAQLTRPAAPGALEYFAHARSSSAEADRRIFDRLHRLGSDLAPLATVPWPSRDLVAMAMVMHHLAFVTDPALDRFLARGARSVVLDWIDRLLDEIRPPATRGDAAARDALLESYFATRRIDTVVRNWAYTYRFYGRPVPANVTALPRLRMVREVTTVVDLRRLFEHLDADQDLGLGSRLRRLVARSPVTELSRPDRFGPLRLGLAGLQVLSDSAIRGGIARRIASAGEWTCAAVIGDAIGAPELRDAPPALLAPALRLLLEVHLTVALDARREPSYPERFSVGALRYAAVLPAWLEHPLALEDVRVLADGHRAVVQRRAESLRGVVPGEVLTETLGLVTRACSVAPLSPPIEVSP